MGGEKLFEIGLADEEIRIFFDVSTGDNQFFTGGKLGGVFAELFHQLSQVSSESCNLSSAAVHPSA